jgi:hypothetical protein
LWTIWVVRAEIGSEEPEEEIREVRAEGAGGEAIVDIVNYSSLARLEM